MKKLTLAKLMHPQKNIDLYGLDVHENLLHFESFHCGTFGTLSRIEWGLLIKGPVYEY